MIKYNPEAIDGVIEIWPGDIYVKTQESIPQLLGHLREIGYTLKDITPEGAKNKGWNLLSGKFEDDVLEHKFECVSCENIIEGDGVGTHDNRCECCGAPTYLEFVNGGEATFSFADDKNSGPKHPTLVIHSYGKEGRKLRVYGDPEDCNGRIEVQSRNTNSTPEAIVRILPKL